jgi:hypothetical protein
MVDRKQKAKKGAEARYNLKGKSPGTYFLQLRPHLLKFPEPSKIAPPAGNQVFNT